MLVMHCGFNKLFGSCTLPNLPIKTMKSRAAVPFVWYSCHEVRHALTQKQVIAIAAETSGLTIKQVEGVMDALFSVACAELKKKGMFKLAGWFRLKLKKQPATEEGWVVPPRSLRSCPKPNVLRLTLLS